MTSKTFEEFYAEQKLLEQSNPDGEVLNEGIMSKYTKKTKIVMADYDQWRSITPQQYLQMGQLLTKGNAMSAKTGSVTINKRLANLKFIDAYDVTDVSELRNSRLALIAGKKFIGATATQAWNAIFGATTEQATPDVDTNDAQDPQPQNESVDEWGMLLTENNRTGGRTKKRIASEQANNGLTQSDQQKAKDLSNEIISKQQIRDNNSQAIKPEPIPYGGLGDGVNRISLDAQNVSPNNPAVMQAQNQARDALQHSQDSIRGMGNRMTPNQNGTIAPNDQSQTQPQPQPMMNVNPNQVIANGVGQVAKDAFTNAKVQAGVMADGVRQLAGQAGPAIQHGLSNASQAVRGAADTVGNTVRDAFTNAKVQAGVMADGVRQLAGQAGPAIQHGLSNASQAVRGAADTVGNTVRDAFTVTPEDHAANQQSAENLANNIQNSIPGRAVNATFNNASTAFKDAKEMKKNSIESKIKNGDSKLLYGVEYQIGLSDAKSLVGAAVNMVKTAGHLLGNGTRTGKVALLNIKDGTGADGDGEYFLLGYKGKLGSDFVLATIGSGVASTTGMMDSMSRVQNMVNQQQFQAPQQPMNIPGTNTPMQSWGGDNPAAWAQTMPNMQSVSRVGQSPALGSIVGEQYANQYQQQMQIMAMLNNPAYAQHYDQLNQMLQQITAAQQPVQQTPPVQQPQQMQQPMPGAQ